MPEILALLDGHGALDQGRHRCALEGWIGGGVHAVTTIGDADARALRELSCCVHEVARWGRGSGAWRSHNWLRFGAIGVGCGDHPLLRHEAENQVPPRACLVGKA